MQPYKYIYGPVPSRRLGRSLGVDIIPFKTCSYDCVYCQLGHTTVHTTERGSWVSCSDVLSELERFLRTDKPDVISFAGSGEPTLNEELGDMIHGIRQMTDVPVAVFTNASLLWMPDVIEDLALADIVSPSRDAALPATAERNHRPAGTMPLDVILEGLTRFCNVYRGRIWLEILLAQGLNDSEEDIAALAAQAAKLRHIERIQLNSVCRPPADSSVKPLTMARLEEIRSRMPGRCEIIASYGKRTHCHGRGCARSHRTPPEHRGRHGRGPWHQQRPLSPPHRLPERKGRAPRGRTRRRHVLFSGGTAPRLSHSPPSDQKTRANPDR